MEPNEAKKILSSIKAVFAADGFKLPSDIDPEAIAVLTGKTPVADILKRELKAGSKVKAALYTALGCAQSFACPITYSKAVKLNKAVFSGLDESAGKLRKTNAETAGNAHPAPEYIFGSLKSILTKMNSVPCAGDASKADAAGYISHYMRELIILRPFEYRSELTLRLLFILFCAAKGYYLCYYRVSFKAIKTAERRAFLTDDVAPLFKLLTTCLSVRKQKPKKPNKKSSAPAVAEQSACTHIDPAPQPARTDEKRKKQMRSQKPKPASAKNQPNKSQR